MYFDVSRGNMNGIFTYLYKTYSSDYTNIVKANGTGATSGNKKDPMAPVMRNVDLYFVGNGSDFNVYLLKHYVHVVHYSIMHSSSSERVITQWKLLGSIDEGEWVTLSEVNDCDENCTNESIHSYPAKEGVFNAFSVLKLNKNSDNSSAFDLIRFELFGSVCLTKDCNVPIRMFHSKCLHKERISFNFAIIIVFVK